MPPLQSIIGKKKQQKTLWSLRDSVESRSKFVRGDGENAKKKTEKKRKRSLSAPGGVQCSRRLAPNVTTLRKKPSPPSSNSALPATPKKKKNKKTHKKHTKQRHFLRSSIRESKKKKNGSPSSDPSDANGAINQRHCKSEIIIHPLISLWFFFVGATRSRFHRQRNLYCIFYFWRYSSPHGWPGRKLGRRPSRRKPKRKIKEK